MVYHDFQQLPVALVRGEKEIDTCTIWKSAPVAMDQYACCTLVFTDGLYWSAACIHSSTM